MFSIAPYRIVVINREGRTTNLWREDGLYGFSTWLHEALREELGVVRQHGEIRRSRVARVIRSESGELVAGIIQTGVNGFSSELVNTETGEVSHHRTVIEAEFVPFFFMVVCPVGEDFGVLLLQRFRNLGVKDFFVDPITQRFSEERGGSGARLRITRLVPTDLAQQLLNESIIKNIRLIRYEEPGEVSESLGEGYAERTGSVEMVFKAKKDGGLPSPPGLLQALTGKTPVNQVYSLENFDYDAIKISVDMNGKRRVIDVGRPDILTPNVDVTEDLDMGNDGHPMWDSLLESFSGFASSALEAEKIDWNIDTVATQDDLAEPLQEA
jgi:hypothetical protein